MRELCYALFMLLIVATCIAQTPKPRARDLGIPFDGPPGPLNAITDVAGVEVGHTTLISGSGKLVVGQGPVRTGVTAILPRGRESSAGSPARADSARAGVPDPAFAGWFPQNGNGEMTGTTWIEESGFLEGPVMITNTHSVGVVRDAVIQWQVKRGAKFQPWSLPVVAETYDGYLNDTDGFHVKPEHAWAALDGARGGPVAEGNVGGGTGMICFGFKGGIGTASRRLADNQGGYTVGVLVQCNTGGRPQLRIAGEPVGRELPQQTADLGAIGNRQSAIDNAWDPDSERGSIIIVVATDAPLLPHQLRRIAKRATMGLARMGATSGNGSGDIFLAFSTANPGAAGPAWRQPPSAAAAARTITSKVEMVSNERISPLFEATVQATEEAITNALIAAEDMRGADDHLVRALPHDEVRAILRKHGRLVEK